MINKRSSAGHPYYKRKGDVLDIGQNFYNTILSKTVDPEIFTRPCVTHRVLQPGDGEIKNR